MKSLHRLFLLQHGSVVKEEGVQSFDQSLHNVPMFVLLRETGSGKAERIKAL
jgi:hypothetical protein